MKILHYFLGKANPERANGVNKVIHGLCKHSIKAGHDVYAVGLSRGSGIGESIARDGFTVTAFPHFHGACHEYLTSLNADIVHMHGVWNIYNVLFMHDLYREGRPYVVSTHAGLIEARLKQSNYIVKYLFHRFLQKRAFSRAAGLHAITREEVTNLSEMTGCKNIFYVPNGHDLSEFTLREKTYDRKSTKKIRFGYLGRFGKEKNILGLIKAISLLPQDYRNRIECHLIGPDNDYSRQCNRLAAHLGVTENVVFRGAIYGDDKYAALRDLDFYVHPAYSDVVSIAVIEAFACGLPAVITRTSQVSYYYDSHAFIMVEPVPRDIARGIVEMIYAINDWPSMSMNSLKLVRETFNWEVSTHAMLNEYRKILEQHE